jgi:hypothetical protein
MEAEMRKRLTLATVLLAVVAAFAAIPLAASGDNESRVVIGVRYNLNLGPPLSGVGTWTACCGINDTGTTHAVVYVTSVKDGFARITGTHTFESAKGTFTDRYIGTLGPLSSPRQIAEGRWWFISGTGAYANISGAGTFLDTVDGTTGLATGIHDGQVSLSGDNDDD